MDAEGYKKILETGLLPFLREKLPNGHKFMQDNDPKHTSRLVSEFMEREGINWWRTPPESPDCNPIEIFGMSSRSTFGERLSRKQNLSWFLGLRNFGPPLTF